MRSLCFRFMLAAALLLGLIGLASTGAEEEGEYVSPQELLAELRWLSGSWSGSMWGGTFHAYYSTPEGGKILSFSRLEKDGKRVFHEFEVFECRKTLVHLLPFPGGKPAAGFTYDGGNKKQRKAVFENPKKDYPTRIEYHRVADDRLVITLSDPHGKSGKTETFDLKRVK